ncbi:MAG: hypothetical protein JSS61_00870 [Verrucomicrobia bacterium]|nr:hypothetical protein [Verrucomicrobiota bacterium]
MTLNSIYTLLSQVAEHNDLSAADELASRLSPPDPSIYPDVKYAILKKTGSLALVRLLATEKIAFDVFSTLSEHFLKAAAGEEKATARKRLATWIYLFNDSSERQIALLQPMRAAAASGERAAFDFLTQWIDAPGIPDATSDTLFDWVCDFAKDGAPPLCKWAINFLFNTHSRRNSEIFNLLLQIARSGDEIEKHLYRHYNKSMGTCPKAEEIFNYRFEHAISSCELMVLANINQVTHPDRARIAYEKAIEWGHPPNKSPMPNEQEIQSQIASYLKERGRLDEIYLESAERSFSQKRRKEVSHHRACLQT